MAMTDGLEPPTQTDEFDRAVDNVINLNARRASAAPTLSWANEVLRGQDKRIVENIPNAVTILAFDRRWDGVLGYNEFERRVFVRKELPWGVETEPLATPRPLTNHDLTHIQMWLQNEKFGGGMWTIGADAVHGAVQIVAKGASYHPIKELFAALPKWDGEARLDAWLVQVFGLEDTLYNRMVGRMFLLGMYRRMMQPGTKMDYMLILEGAQGLRKSTACAVLCFQMGYGVAHFKSLDSVDTSIFLRNKWLIEFGEMHTLRKAEVNELKLWLVKEIEDYRPKYGRTNEVEPRQCCFIGTSNATEYLNDSSGGRRFWPVKCEKADIEKLLEIRDQLWAEVAVRAAEGELHYPTPEIEAEHFAPQQAARMVEDPWEATIFPAAERMNRITQSYVCQKLGIQSGKLDRLTDTRIKEIFAKHKWTRGKGMHGVYYQNPVIKPERTLDDSKPKR